MKICNFIILALDFKKSYMIINLHIDEKMRVVDLDFREALLGEMREDVILEMYYLIQSDLSLFGTHKNITSFR